MEATPTSSRALAPVRFTVPSTHILHPSEPATITFPPELQDAEEKMFVLMAILQTETMRLDVRVKLDYASEADFPRRKIMILGCSWRLVHSPC